MAPRVDPAFTDYISTCLPIIFMKIKPESFENDWYEVKKEN
jgi:hypothetical protein